MKKLLIALLMLQITANAQVFLGLGASVSKMEFDYLMDKYPTIPNYNENLILVNGNKPATTLEDMLNGKDYFERYVADILNNAEVDPAEVDYIWFMSASLSNNINSLNKDQYVAYEVGLFKQILTLIHQYYPNATVYLSGRGEGYADRHKAPRAEYDYYAVKQITDEGLAILAHPFYLQPWSESYTTDGVHPNEQGLSLAYNYMVDWYTKNTNWFTIKPDTIKPPVFIVNKNNTGFNGQQWFGVFNPATADSTILLNLIPEGEGFTLRFRADKDSNLLNSIELLKQQNELLKRHNRSMQVIYCTDVVYASPQSVVSNVAGLINAGVAIVAVEADNEFYAINPDFNYYRSKFLPIRQMLLQSFPTLPFTIFICPRPYDSNGNGVKDDDDILGGRADHRAWNIEVKNYLITAPAFDGISTHIYLNNRELPSIAIPPTKFIYNYNDDYPTLTAYYQKILSEYEANKSLWQRQIDYLNREFPNKDVYVTEFGITGSDLRNTWATSYIIYDIFTNYYTNFKYLLLHNGFARTNTGIASWPTMKETGNKLFARSDYYMYQSFRSGGYVNADKLYSTSGPTSWMATGSNYNYAIKVSDDDLGATFSFGTEPEAPQICYKDTVVITGYDTILTGYDTTYVTSPLQNETTIVVNGTSVRTVQYWSVEDPILTPIYALEPKYSTITIPIQCKLN